MEGEMQYRCHNLEHQPVHRIQRVIVNVVYPRPQHFVRHPFEPKLCSTYLQSTTVFYAMLSYYVE